MIAWRKWFQLFLGRLVVDGMTKPEALKAALEDVRNARAILDNLRRDRRTERAHELAAELEMELERLMRGQR